MVLEEEILSVSNRVLAVAALSAGTTFLAFLLPGNRVLLLLALLLCGGLSWLTVRVTCAMQRRMVFLEGALDAVPQPLTVTDLDMHWFFVNKTTEAIFIRRWRNRSRR